METNWLRIGGIVSLLAVAVLLWVGRAPAPRLETRDGTGRVEPALGEKPAGRPGEIGGAPVPDGRLALRRGLDAEAKARPRRGMFRELNQRRPPELEADPQFQRLLEIDSARKMALLENDREDLRRVRQDLLAGGDIPRRVLEQALLDSNTEVRLAALYEISLEMGEPPLDLLAPVLQGDPSAEVRLEALSIVADVENAEADGLIQGALDDPDEEIRDEAEDLIESRVEDSF